MIFHRSLIILTAMSALATARELPLQLFDTHLHFVSDDLKLYPFSAPPKIEHQLELRQYHLKNSPTTEQKVLALWSANRVEGGIGVQYGTTYGTDNAYLLAVAAEHPERVGSVVMLNADDPTTPGMIRTFAEKQRISGVRFSGLANATGDFPWLDSPAALDSWAVAQELGLVVVLMPLPVRSPNVPALERIALMSDKFPAVRIVLDHIGFPLPDGAPGYGLGPAHWALKSHKNIYYKFTSINVEMQESGKVPLADFVRHLVDFYGADRIMWGSDFGNTLTPYDEIVATAISSTGKLDAGERKQVLHDTGKAVFVPGGKRAKRWQSSLSSQAR